MACERTYWLACQSIYEAFPTAMRAKDIRWTAESKLVDWLYGDSEKSPPRLPVGALNQIEIAAGVFNNQSIHIASIVFQAKVALIEKAEIHPATGCFRHS